MGGPDLPPASHPAVQVHQGRMAVKYFLLTMVLAAVVFGVLVRLDKVRRWKQEK